MDKYQSTRHFPRTQKIPVLILLVHMQQTLLILRQANHIERASFAFCVMPGTEEKAMNAVVCTSGKYYGKAVS